jgi:acyl transferase domain-containing protein/3-hydroxymyristoyl/3-hydroxydecanoyl-(acyl carrier protein) dehydratase
MASGDRVAIVGMAGRFPGSGADLDLFWENVAAGRDCSREIPAGRWLLPPAECVRPGGPHPDAVPHARGYYLDPFEPHLDGLELPSELVADLDPLFHLVLDVGNRAWRSAKTDQLDRRRVGVVLGNICLPTDRASDLARRFLGGPFGLDAPAVHPLNRFVAGLPAGLLARGLGLGGGTFTLDAACASSLYALKLAADDLLAGRADAVLAGGCNRSDALYTQMGFAQLRALSASGRCGPFDAAADGLMVGEGAGVFVLKRLSDALAHGDTVHAVLCGWGLSNDLGANLLSPATEGQLRAMRAAYRRAGWRPTDVDLVECHATGTPVGDATEFESLCELWRDAGDRPGRVAIGSVKSSVGHLLTGAGAAAVTKIVLAMARKVRPPQANFAAPHAGLRYDESPFRVLAAAEPWEETPGRPRRAAASGFGFGGVNAHLLLEEWVPQEAAPAPGDSALRAKLRAATQQIERAIGTRSEDPHAGEPVAVVGMAARLGPWETLREFQEYALGGGRPAPPRPKAGGWAAAGGVCPPGFYVEGMEVPLDRFRIPPTELTGMLPQQVLMLQAAAAALDDCKGDAPAAADGDPATGVFVGLGLDLNTTNFHLRWAVRSQRPAVSGQRSEGDPAEAAGRLTSDLWSLTSDAASPPLTADRVMGALGSIAASRIARAFNLGGPSFTVCSEETSAARAVELAVRALRTGEIDRAVVGGVDLPGDPRAVLSVADGRPFAPDGVAMPFGRHAGGAVPGEGAAAVVLKRLADAERDGDRVYAVIRGVGSASGGQADTYATSFVRACADAAAEPATIGYLEAAAAGTPGEDGVEADALAAVVAATDRAVPLTVGTAKAQVGHTGFASALAGLVKACLAVYHQVLPPAAQPGEFRDEIDAVAARLHFPATPRYWLHDRTAGPRRAAVAAVGVDGSTAHVVIEEHAGAADEAERAQPLGARPEAVFAVEGDTPGELADGLGRLYAWLPAADAPVERLARDWFRRVPASADRRLAVTLVPRSAAELREQIDYALRAVTTRPESPLPDPAQPDPRPAVRDRVFYDPYPVGRGGKVAFVFPGSGNQFAGMGRDLGVQWPAVLRRQQMENAGLRSQYAPHLFWDDAIPPAASPRDFLFGQVTLGTLAADLLAALGVRPDAMIGQSLGESAGLFGVRVWTARDEMLRRIRTSSLFATDLGPPYESARRFYGRRPGEIVDWVVGVLPVPADAVREHLSADRKAYLLIVTTPTECVVGGLRDDVAALVAALDKPLIPLSGVTLAHCEAGKPVEAAYRRLHRLPVSPVPVTVYSGAWGRAYEPTEEAAADSITAGLLNTIDFPRVVEAAYRDGVRVFVEAGPGNSAVRMIAATLGDRAHIARAVCVPRQDGPSLVLRLVAHLLAERVPVSLAALYGGPSACAAHQPDEPDGRRVLTLPAFGPTVPPPEPPPEPEPEPAPEPELAEAASRLLASVEAEPEPVVEEAPAPLVQTPLPPAPKPRPVPVPDIAPFVAAAAASQRAAADAHARFLRVQEGLTQTAVAAVQLQMELTRRLAGQGGPLAPRAGGLLVPELPAVSRPAQAAPLAERADYIVPRSLTYEQCRQFAVGRIGDVLGPLFAEIDAHPTRVRLPDGPLMLVDRILAIEGEPKSLGSGRVVTDHAVHAGRWYLDAGRCPTSVTVESGQADLFLSGFLGIDFRTKGLAVYRLLDAVVTFHRGLPRVGERIEYDIRIDGFFRQADSWLFRFRFEGTIDGEPLLSMKNGVAGFFTQEALAAGQGIVHTKLDRQPMPGRRPADWRELVPVSPTSLDAAQVEALRRGDYAAAFGPDFRPTLADPVRLPGGMLRLVDRVPVLDPAGGRFGQGFVRAEYDIRPQEWFIECHFVDDKVMPGTLMYECCLHTLRVFLMRLGWVGEATEVVCEPVPGVDSRLKCRGQVLETTRTVTYEVSVKELGYGPEPFAVADALMYADGKPIVEITNLSLRMSGLTREKLERTWTASPQSPPSAEGGRAPLVYDSASIMAFSNGNPSEAFGEPYRVFDRDRVIARLPGPPYQFLDRVTNVVGEPFVLKAGAACTAEYAVPPDAWYFDANRCPTMPFSVLLEIALQPCGWLAAYCGSALTSPTDLSFRNLGGEGTQLRPVTPESGTLVTDVGMTKVSQSAGMIIQHYDMRVSDREGVVYLGTTYFGFFGKEALRNQVGMPAAKVPYLSDDQKAFADAGELPHDPPFPGPMLRMVDRIDGYLPHGGAHKLGLVQGRIAVDPGFWFFRAHFHQDPVWPGSLGLESFLQLLKYVAWRKWGDPPAGGWQTVGLNAPHAWVYRGQVLPTDREVTVVLEVTAADAQARRLTADGFLSVDGRVIYQMTGFTLEYP